VVAVNAFAVPVAPGASAAAQARPVVLPSSAPPAGPVANVPPRRGPKPVEHYVDLNSASRQELMTLPGIGAVEAGKIIANRPYLTKSELVTKNVLPIGPFLSVKHLVVAMPKTTPKGKA
jgi:DNA uptake protein ComE-like DNA-binding protein